MLWENHQRLVHFLVRQFVRMTGAHWLRDDMTQAGLLGLWRAAHAWDGETADFSTYAFVAVRRHIRNEKDRYHPKGGKAARRKEPEPKRHAIGDDVNSRITTPVKFSLDDRDEVRHLLSLLAGDRQRDVVTLYYLEGKTLEDIADVLGISRSLAGRILNQALSMIDRKLKGTYAPKPKRTHWNKIFVNEKLLRELYEGGVGIVEIADRLSISTDLVNERRKKLGLPQRYRRGPLDERKLVELYDKGVSLKAIAAELGVSTVTLDRARRRLGLPERLKGPRVRNGVVTLTEDGVTALRHAGKSAAEIASHFNVQESVIANCLMLWGLS